MRNRKPPGDERSESASTAVSGDRPRLRLHQPDDTHPRPAEMRPQLAEPGMSSNPDAKSKKVEVNPYHFWHARFWHGMGFGTWTKLLARNRIRIGLTKR